LTIPSIPLSPLLALLLSAGVAHASDAVDRIDLLCTEQPIQHVIFGDGGQVDYREEPPRETAPVQLAVIKTGGEPDASAAGGSVVARIESDADYLRTEQASWAPGRSVQAPEGRLHLNLENNVLTLSETGANSETWFRRFKCEPIVVASE
jgi:hypothetical protein